MASSSFRDDGAAALEWVASYLERVGELRVSTSIEPGAVRAALAPQAPEYGEPFVDVLRDLDEVLLPGIVHWNHPRFFAYFSITGSEPSILAELLSAALNVNAMAWSTSPAATELELLALDWLADLLGLPAGWHGHIEDSASTSTLAAIVAARGLRPGGVVYGSEHAHFSVEKGARIAGLEYRAVPVDGEFRMRTDVPLDDATAVVATVGTTSSTSIDPVRALAERCREAGVWLHIDASYAGAAWVLPELRWTADGCELADSIVVNPHKWLFTTIDCSALWTRRPEAFRTAFSAHGDYLPASEHVVDLREYGPVLGRRFRALKLWAVMRAYGRRGLQELIREHIRLAALFEEWVRDEPGWQLVAPRHFSTVCFRHETLNSDELARRATATGELFLATTRLSGEPTIRLTIGNARTQESDVQRAWDVLRRVAAW
jgi:aromatic-L-amino-acid decarboxylase